MARYQDTLIRRDRNKKRYLSTEDYPTISKKDTDILITGRYGLRMDNLANEYYGSPGKEYRIPVDISETGEEFITGGGQVGSVSTGGGGGGY